jgi:hypothetical protein
LGAGLGVGPVGAGGPVGPLLGATPVPVTMTVGATAVSALLAPSVSVVLSALAGALAVNCTPIPHVSPGSSVSPSHSSLPVGIAKSAAFVPEIDAAPVNGSPIGPAFWIGSHSTGPDCPTVCLPNVNADGGLDPCRRVPPCRPETAAVLGAADQRGVAVRRPATDCGVGVIMSGSAFSR